MSAMAFPVALTDPQALDLAKAMLDGFNRHYRLFRQASAAAKQRFEAADWHGQQRAQRERIEFYDKRVDEAAERLQSEFKAGELSAELSQQFKLHYVGLLINHHQPELAETFFNSVTTKILHRRYFNNDFIFVRPTVSTEYIEVDDPASSPTFHVYYPTKDTTRELIQSKYLLVKQHDRVGRMADTLEYSNVAFPRARFDAQLVAELQKFCPSLLEEDGGELVIRHAYIERRMIPLNIYLQEAAPEQIEQAVVEYGNAIKDLVAANIFPGDMLWKNFGVTRHGKVVFYDYDEIEYITDCNFRRVPAPRHEEDEMSGEVWYHVGPKDVFPETFAPFLLGNAKVRDVFMRHHGDLLDASFWQEHKDRILAGHVHDVFPYEPAKRFERQGLAIAHAS